EGYMVSHEGFIGVLNDKLQEETYAKMEKEKLISFPPTTGWLGITDKYWAATLVPDPAAKMNPQFAFFPDGIKRYQTSYTFEPLTIAPGANAASSTRLFAGAKEARVVGVDFLMFGFDGYNKTLGLNRFDLLIDWGY